MYGKENIAMVLKRRRLKWAGKWVRKGDHSIATGEEGIRRPIWRSRTNWESIITKDVQEAGFAGNWKKAAKNAKEWDQMIKQMTEKHS